MTILEGRAFMKPKVRYLSTSRIRLDAAIPPTRLVITMMTGRMNFMARAAMIKPIRAQRKNWISPENGSRVAAAVKARTKHRIKMPAR